VGSDVPSYLSTSDNLKTWGHVTRRIHFLGGEEAIVGWDTLSTSAASVSRPLVGAVAIPGLLVGIRVVVFVSTLRVDTSFSTMRGSMLPVVIVVSP
jgi:hypothetical protein